MTTPQPISNTALSLNESSGRQLLQSSISEYITFLRRQPAICGTPEQHEAIVRHVAKGHELIKLVATERLKITRQLDKQKHDWMEVEKEMTVPIHAAIQPLKDAVDHYNRELLRVREHQQAEATRQASIAPSGDTNWLTPEVSLAAMPKGVQLKWAFEIVDPNQVPNGYWTIDEATIKEAIAKGVREIPGVRIYEEAITTYRK